MLIKSVQSLSSVKPVKSTTHLGGRFFVWTADKLAMIAFATYVFCSYFGFLTIKLADLPIFGQFLQETYLSIVISLCVMAIMMRGWDWHSVDLTMAAAIISVLFISCVLSGVNTLVVLILLLLAIKDLNPISLVRILFWVSIVVLCTCLIYIKLFNFREFWDLLDGHEISGLGAVHPNAYSIMLFNTFLSMCFILNRDRLFFPLISCALLCTAFVFFIQHSDTTLAVFVLLDIALFVEHCFPKAIDRVIFSPVCSVSLVLLSCIATISILFAVAFYSPDNSVLIALNKVLHGRIAFPNVVYREYGGYPILGTALRTWTGSTHAARMAGLPMMMLDCSYARYALTTGILSVVCMGVLFIRALRQLKDRNDTTYLLWIAYICMLLYFIMEFYPSHLCMNCTLPFLAYGLQSNYSKSRTRGNDSCYVTD